MMEYLYLALFGLVAGAVAKFVMPGPDPGGIIVTMLIGIAGSFVGGFIASMLGLATAGFGLMSLISAVVGALILLFVYKKFIAPNFQ